MYNVYIIYIYIYNIYLMDNGLILKVETPRKQSCEGVYSLAVIKTF